MCQQKYVYVYWQSYLQNWAWRFSYGCKVNSWLAGNIFTQANETAAIDGYAVCIIDLMCVAVSGIAFTYNKEAVIGETV